ncbi:hypothetical protein BDN70DRAFT_796694 [Pholiota conissans]|uniref:DUF6699 domain-containing protein n=1 Tax=Pholiota conissans TaxID=109636 RepID=A0A9P5ZCK7_9AGAR|nr:hypothetical protein BDN70DRAFT_796694 [Pholiota conissans]
MPVHDRMEPFATGPHYGPVLDPMLIKIVNAPVKINPLISPPVEEGPEQPYLKWDMLFETSFVQRSDEPAHQSWMNGRGAPATFPRLSSLRLITTQIPWMIDVVARDLERGVTCEEVIEAIAHNLGKSSSNSDYACLHRHDQAELSHAYRYNRSPNPGVPGGRLKEAMKRLDYLRTNTSFGGIVVDDRTVKRLCGSELPCVFVLKCNKRFMSQKDVQEHETRMRRAAGGTSRAASKGPPSARSRGHSPNGMITVHPPSSSSYTTDSDEGGVDR